MKMKLLTPTNIESELKKIRNQESESTLFEINLKELLNEQKIVSKNNFSLDLLKTDNIFHLDQIKKVCIDYRLRFLDLAYFKGNLPESAESEIELLEKEHQTQLGDFKLMAPSVLFRLEKTDDPLLFVPIGNQYYYLVHKWGNDLHPLRKILMWPFKGIWHLLSLVLVISFLVTLITPISIFTKSTDASSFWMLFFFMFKAIASVVLFYGFALGKNFNPAIWNSKYNKAL
jgi:hypothetical protein